MNPPFIVKEKESDLRAFKSVLSEALVLALDFKERWFEISSIENEKVKKRIKNYVEKINPRSIELKEFVKVRLKSIQSKLEERCKREPDRFMRFPFLCQECFQKAVAYGKDYDLLECLFCNHKIKPKDYPDYLFELSSNRLDEFECIECGVCGEENGIVGARDDKNIVIVEVEDNYPVEYKITAHCLFCQSMLYTGCEQCNRVLDKQETQRNTGGLCLQCWENYLERN